MKNRIIYFLLFALLIPCWGIGWKPAGDTGTYYSAAQFIHTIGISTFYAECDKVGHLYYGPVGLILLEPVALLSVSAFSNIVLFIQTLSYLVFWYCFLQFFPSLKERKNLWLFIFVWISSIKPIHASFQSHNVQLFFAAIIMLSEIWTRSTNGTLKFLAGVAVSLIAGIKIYPLFVAIYYFLRKPKETRLGLLFGGILFFLIPILRFGIDIGRVLPGQFVVNSLRYHQIYDLALDTVSLSLPSLLARWMPQSFISHGVIPITVGVLAFCFFFQSWLSREEERMESGKAMFALMLAVMAMLNSTTRPDYFIYFVPAFASIFTVLELAKPASAKIYALGVTFSLALIAFITEWTLQSRDLNHLLESYRVPVFGIMLLCYLLARAIRSFRPQLTA